MITMSASAMSERSLFSEPETPALTISQAAKRLFTSRGTIYRLIRLGELQAWAIPGGNPRVRQDDVDALVKRFDAVNGTGSGKPPRQGHGGRKAKVPGSASRAAKVADRVFGAGGGGGGKRKRVKS